MRHVDYFVCGEYVLAMDEGTESVLRDGVVAVSEGRIVEVGPKEEIFKKYSANKTLSGERRAVLPGLVNTHTHAAMVLLRGFADDLPLKDWLEGHIWPTENRWLGPGFVRDAGELACLEMLRAGITAFCDMYFFEGVTAETVKKLGMKAVLGAGILDFPTKTTSGAEDCLRKGEEFIRQWKGDEHVRPCIAPHAAYTCGPETLGKAENIASRHDVIVHIHLSETEGEVRDVQEKYGKRPGMLLDEVGLLNERLLAAHCVWLDDEEIDLLAERNVKVSHCVESNLKLASGLAPVSRMLGAGIKVSLGTDGAASNNDLNILSEMSTAAKLHKAVSGDPTALDSHTVLRMATCWGAEAIGLKDTGRLKAGYAADLVSIDLDKPHLTPLYNICSHLVYAARAGDVDTVMVNGKVVVEYGRLKTANEEEILHKAREWAEKIKCG
jgi:5-methylthioadenosine/S-adenosylhomocysteine deaminase